MLGHADLIRHVTNIHPFAISMSIRKKIAVFSLINEKWQEYKVLNISSLVGLICYQQKQAHST